MMIAYRFAAAAPDEEVVYGACRPAQSAPTPAGSSVEDWIHFMKEKDVTRVVCLLDDPQLSDYDDLLGTYREAFGDVNVRHAPIPDFMTVNRDTLYETILTFLEESDALGDRVVVHCAAGSGRTGHVLALWLVHARNYDLEEAIETVRGTGREPLEGATIAELSELMLGSGTKGP